MKKMLLTVLCTAICLLAASCLAKPDENKPAANEPAQSKLDSSVFAVYENKDYKVTFSYPSNWKPNNTYSPARYEGTDGFFQITAISGKGLPIDKVTEFDAYHKLLPYGTSPRIEAAAIGGQETRLIIPSEDQPKEMNGQAGAVVKYPQPVSIGGNIYYYFEIWADKDHIRSIAESLKFIN